jgi:hypothetical protein
VRQAAALVWTTVELHLKYALHLPIQYQTVTHLVVEKSDLDQPFETAAMDAKRLLLV